MKRNFILTNSTPFKLKIDLLNPHFEIWNFNRLKKDKLQDRNTVWFNNGTSKIPLDSSKSVKEISDEINDLVKSQNLIEFKLELEDKSSAEIEFDYSTTNNFISIEDPIRTFGEHLENPINERIIFSAPFGQGKSTFLNSFFLGYTDHFNLFKVYPVNYSVATNQDIFKYIKCDILFQLLSHDVEFDFLELTKKMAIEEFILLNPKKILRELLNASAQVDLNAKIIATTINSLDLLNSAIEKYRKEARVDERERAIHYLSEIYEDEGSIYEDNFFTQLIRKLLEQLEVRTGKRNVLIIEDLDRIDPDHMFRILNVISAHYDTYKYSEIQESHNKFGFEKIITVCDKNNIKSVFHHRYGELADFTGYFNKFYSVSPFEFSNNEAVVFHLNLIEDAIRDKARLQVAQPYLAIAKKILWDLISNNMMTLRELIKFAKIDLYQEVLAPIQKSRKQQDGVKSSLFIVLFEYLKRIDNIEHKISRLTNIDSNYDSFDYEHIIPMGFIPLGHVNKEGIESFQFNGLQYSYRTARRNLPFKQCIEITNGYESLSRFTNKDFYDIFELNIQHYKKIGGVL